MKPQQPDPGTFQPGDIIWPKKPGVFVPYESKLGADYTTDRTQWEQDRTAFVAQSRRKSLKPAGAQTIALLESMSFDEFLALYLGDIGGVSSANAAFNQGKGGPIYVGHCGMVYFQDKQPWVVEAVKPTVRRISYAKWIAERREEDVWHGRLKGVEQTDRERVAAEANKYVGRPYKFWNYNLDDDSGFYCSKLVWLAVFRTLRLALDDIMDPDRPIWYSPKQLLHSPHIECKFCPGRYFV